MEPRVLDHRDSEGPLDWDNERRWSERVTFEGKRLVVGTEINRTEFSLAS